MTKGCRVPGLDFAGHLARRNHLAGLTLVSCILWYTAFPLRLSVLSCCAPRCGPGLTHLELSGCPPLTPAVAQAVAEAAPGLKSLTISFSSRVELQRPRKKADLTAYERFLLYLQFQLRWPWQRGRWQAIQYFAAQHLSEVRWEPWTAAGAHQPPPWDLPEGQGDQPFEALPPAHTGAGGSGLTLYGTGGAGGGPAAAGSPVGFLATCGGGRLQRLRLLRAGRWLPGSFAALEACSRLTELEVSLTGSTWPYGFAGALTRGSTVATAVGPLRQPRAPPASLPAWP